MIPYGTQICPLRPTPDEVGRGALGYVLLVAVVALLVAVLG